MAEMNENNIEEMIDETVDTAASDTTTEAAADAVEAIGDKIEDAVEEAAEEKKDVAPVSSNIKQGGDNEPHWYVVHTYSGYENKVKADIEKTIENRRLQEQMFEVMVPVQDVVEVKNGARKTVPKKMFPGYVLVHMIKNDVTWYVVRNTRGVTGFVGPGSEPVPLTDAEMRLLGVKTDDFVIDVAVGDSVKVISGAWEGTVGTIKQINTGKQSVTIDMDIFGRSTDVEIGLGDILKL